MSKRRRTERRSCSCQPDVSPALGPFRRYGAEAGERVTSGLANVTLMTGTGRGTVAIHFAGRGPA